MKKILFALTCMFFLLAAHAATITVSNNPASPGQYSNLQTAINAAAPGDVILVTGSGTDYVTTNGNTEITINKKLTIYGQGYAPAKDVPNASLVSTIHLLAGANNTVIEGFNVSNRIYSDAGVANILISRNFIYSSFSPNGDNWIITENIVSGNFSINGNNITVKNNLLNTGGSIYSSGTTTNLIFTNNIISNYPGIGLYNAQVSNNIFYNKNTVNAAYFSSSHSCTITNNIDFNNNNTNPFNIGVNGCTGSGNLLNSNPLFTYVAYSNGSQFDASSNLALLPASPGKNAGTDGKDLGIYGSGTPAQYPLTGQPAIPQIATMNIANIMVAPGGTLTVQLKAKANN